MKIYPEFIARDIAGDLVLVPVGEAARKCAGLITCNEVGAFIWHALEDGCSESELLTRVLDEFDTDESTASADIREFIGKLTDLGALIP